MGIAAWSLRRTCRASAASATLDPAGACLVWWQSAACHAYDPGLRPAAARLLPDCALVESSYRPEPIARTLLPARREFVERYLADPAPVGFYRLRRP